MPEISPLDTDRISELQLAKQKYKEDNQISIPKIQRVPAVLRQNEEFAKYCTPKMISFGPIHHGDKNLKQAEHYKLLWTSMYVEEYNKQNDQVTTEQVAHQTRSLLTTVEDNIGELKKLFAEDVIGTKTDKDLAWMLFVDGCSLLHFMAKIDKQHPEVLNLKLDQMMYIWRDIFLLENQLPMRLLEMLSKKEAKLDCLMINFQCMGDLRLLQFQWKRQQENKAKKTIIGDVISIMKQWISKKREADLEQQQPITNSHSMVDVVKRKHKPFHLLDYVRTFVTAASHNDQVEQNGKDVKNQQDGSEGKEVAAGEKLYGWPTYKNIRDLKAAGILVQPSKKDGMIWSSVSFTSKLVYGKLSLPMFMFDNISPYFFRNLIAYEMCPDFHNDLECCSYFCFMDSLIDGGEDVKELRLAGVIQNMLGSDEELAKLFIDMGRDLPTKVFNCTWSTEAMAYSKKYIEVKNQMEKHYTSTWRTFGAVTINTYFSTPWSILAFLAAVAALALTCVQTCNVSNGGGDVVVVAEKVDVAMKGVLAGLEKIMKSSDCVRLKTLKGVLDLLTPMQCVYFLAANIAMQLRLRQWGKKRDMAASIMNDK